MSRLQLVEIHDLAECPRVWRDSLTAFLQFTIDTLGIYDCIVPKIQMLMERSGTHSVVDLCSGGGGPWLRLRAAVQEEVGQPVRVSLTDKFPNIEAFEQARAGGNGHIVPLETSVDATDVPADLEGVRTLFSSFHHFDPAVAQAILQDAVDKRAPIGVFEFTDRTALSCLAMTFAPLLALGVVPFQRPFSWTRLLSCVPVPMLPLMIGWDGFVSNLRTYTVDELKALVEPLDAVDYEWEFGKIDQGLVVPPVTYLIGWPRG